ncbi:MAG: phosphatidylserine decarboxylase [Oscillospiraceae bacterium]|nr:phosphatidylserine decarboxylase [Oscillospiraceae bacterium]
MGESRGLRFLYHTAPGRTVLRALSGRVVSRLCGRFLDSPLSRPLIGPFVRKNGIRLSDYVPQVYPSFNAFFTRPIRPELRPFPQDPAALAAPCDGLLSVYPVEDGAVLPVKQSAYTIGDLLGGDPLAAGYAGGYCLVFRLCVDHYHRYCYLDSGRKGGNRFLPGRLHTVRPIALEAYPVFTQNCREYTVLETDHFGSVVQVEVGAMLVGRIENLHGPGPITRGAEKGRFLYGGSTIILLLPPGRVRLTPALLENTRRGVETPVRMGQVLGHACLEA